VGVDRDVVGGPHPTTDAQPCSREQRWLTARVLVVDRDVIDREPRTRRVPARVTGDPSEVLAQVSQPHADRDLDIDRDGRGARSRRRLGRQEGDPHDRTVVDRVAARRRQSTASAATGEVRAAARPGSTDASSPAASATTRTIPRSRHGTASVTGPTVVSSVAAPTQP